MSQRTNIIITALLLAIAQCVGLFVVCAAFTLDANAAFPEFCGDTVRGLAHHNCAGVDGDNDGYTTDGSDTWYSVGTATANGGEITAQHAITVDAGHTIKDGAWVSIPLSGGGTAERHVILASATELAFVGNLSDAVADNAVITALPLIDGDDTNMWVYPGTYVTTGCSAGEHKLMLDDGTYGACNDITCDDYSPTNNCFWIDADTGSDANPGTEASPFASFVNTNSYYYGPTDDPPGKVSVPAGTAIIVTGQVSQTANYYGPDGDVWDNTVFNMRGQDGTTSDPIRVISKSGQRGGIDTGTATGSLTHCEPNDYGSGAMYIFQQGNILIEDLDITNNGGDHGGPVGIDVSGDGDGNIRLLRNYISGGECYQNDNCAGMRVFDLSNDVEASHNVVKDIKNFTDGAGLQCTQTGTSSYNVAGTNPGNPADDTREDAPLIQFFRPQRAVVRHNVMGVTTPDTVGSHAHGFFTKHGKQLHLVDGYSYIEGNVAANVENGFWMNSSRMIIRNNRAINVTLHCFGSWDPGGTTYSQYNEFYNNTCSNGTNCLYWSIQDDQNDDGSVTTACNGNSAPGPFTWRDNVCDEISGSFFIVGSYDNEDNYNRFIAADKYFYNNSYFRSGADESTAAHSIYETVGGCGSACNQRKCWGADTTRAIACSTFGVDCTNSEVEDQALDADHISTVSTTRGWNFDTPETTTTSTTTTTTNVPVAANGGALGRFRR